MQAGTAAAAGNGIAGTCRLMMLLPCANSYSQSYPHSLQRAAALLLLLLLLLCLLQVCYCRYCFTPPPPPLLLLLLRGSPVAASVGFSGMSQAPFAWKPAAAQAAHQQHTSQAPCLPADRSHARGAAAAHHFYDDWMLCQCACCCCINFAVALQC
jgi:hypothetical protein